MGGWEDYVGRRVKVVFDDGRQVSFKEGKLVSFNESFLHLRGAQDESIAVSASRVIRVEGR